jgi:hypothetical protein
MQKKRKSGIFKSLLGLTAILAAMFLWIGCNGDSGGTDNNGTDPNNPNNPDNPNNPNTPIPTIPPEKPLIAKIQNSFELVNVELKDFVGDPTDDQQSAVVALTWEGEGAATYNVYWDVEGGEHPDNPNLTGITGSTAFARGLLPETLYYFWVEAVNPNGNTSSDAVEQTTGKKGPKANDGVGVERAHYPEGLKVSPGNGSLTVSWNLVDRVAWYEVYYAPVGTIKHLDVYTPVEFKWDSSVAGLKAGAIDISGDAKAEDVAYQATEATGTVGYTRPIYPFLSPLATNGGWTGYYVRDGASRVDGDSRPIIGVDALEAGTFYKVYEAYDKGIQDPYKKLDAAFANAIPWDGTKAGTPGTPVKFFDTSTTITGLTDGTTYEVWIRSPNANGERAYSYILGTPGVGDVLAAPSTVQVSTPTNSTRDLAVSWTQVPGADGYRVYASKFGYTPNATANSTPVTEAEATAGSTTLVGLQSDTTYYVWVVAEKGGQPGVFGAPVSGKTGAAPATGTMGDKLIVGTTEKVKTIVYVEVNDQNPLNAGSYILEDGTYLFDYVVLFAANIRNRTPCDDGCTETGVHLHFNPNVRYILNNRTKYIKPLQDKGIKVLLGLLGDHDGISFGSMDDTQRATFIADVKKDVETYGLDGVDFDDEWGSKEDWDNWTNNYANISPNSVWTYPTSTWGWPTNVTVYRDPSKGIVPGNGRIGAGAAPSDAEMTAMWRESGESYYKTIKAAREALPGKIITLYEYNTGRYVTAGGEDNGEATKDGLLANVDFALQPWYNQYIAESANGLPNSIYSPFGMDVGGEAYSSQNGAPNPPIIIGGNEQANNTIYDYATRFKNQATAAGGAHNLMYFYALRPATELLKHASTDSRASVTKEEYISIMSEIVFGQKTLLTAEGGDYRKDW